MLETSKTNRALLSEAMLHKRPVADTLDAAFHLRDYGLSVIPLRGKKPDTSIVDGWLRYQTKQPSYEDLNTWFTRPGTNLGIVLGALSDLVAVDADSAAGCETWEALGRNTPLVAASGKRGKHYFYHYPTDGELRKAKLPGIGDLLAEGSYVVAPPSVHPETGRPYAWLEWTNNFEQIGTCQRV